jgi:3-isopropylmalate dehydrogenase
MTKTIAVLPGDGIGPEIMAKAVKVYTLTSFLGLDVHLESALVDGAAIFDATCPPLPTDTLALAKRVAAVLLTAVGEPKWDPLKVAFRPEKGLLGLRFGLGLLANLRPAMLYPELLDASTLKAEVMTSLNILIVRELTGDRYLDNRTGFVLWRMENDRGLIRWFTVKVRLNVLPEWRLPQQRSGSSVYVE